MATPAAAAVSAGPLVRALRVEIGKRERRIKAITPKLVALRDEYKVLCEQRDSLRTDLARYEGTASPSVAPPATPSSQSAVERDVGPSKQRMVDIVDCLREHGQLSPLEIVSHLRIERGCLQEPLRQLREDGRVIAIGATADRRYQLADHAANQQAASA